MGDFGVCVGPETFFGYYFFLRIRKVLVHVKHTNSETSRQGGSEFYGNHTCGYQKLL